MVVAGTEVVGAYVGSAAAASAAASSAGSRSASAVVEVLASSVAPRTLACAPVSVAPGTTAMATAEATAKGSSARAPFRIQSGTHQEKHKGHETYKVRKVQSSQDPPALGPVSAAIPSDDRRRRHR